MTARKKSETAQSKVERIARRHEALHQEQLQRDKKRAKSDSQKESRPKPAPTTKRGYPATPLPKKTIAKPGIEADVEPGPSFSAPEYKGSEKLAGKVAIVTGGDSGIGRAVAVLYAREGADVVIAYLNEHEDALETKRSVEEEGRAAILLSGDIRDKAFCEKVAREAMKAFGRIDILVNNAAFQLHAAQIDEISEERLDETFRTNVFGYFHMAEAVLPHMKEGAAIINTGSVVGLEGSPQLLDYAATKGAIHAFTKSLAKNVIKRGIRVNAVAPGPVWTPLNPADKDAEAVSKFGADTDMHRPAQPEELSPAYVFLAAPSCSSYITGVVLPITGSVQ
ncbi:MAG TPA: SDR family oxidoreductase [Dongiaceae bacterium]|nr:SDR family oxidoreductase [Dongiaceae bacterium]